MGAKESKPDFTPYIEQLLGGPISDPQIWAKVLNTQLKRDNIGIIFNTEIIEKLQNTQPENFKALLIACLTEIETPEINQERHVSVTNSVNMMIRLIPFCLTGEWDDFWWSGDEPFGLRLLQGILALLFAPGYCMPEATEAATREISVGAVWKAGLVHKQPVRDPPKGGIERRSSLLQLLIVVLSGNVYFTMDVQATYVNIWKIVLCSSKCPNIDNLFYSLLNYVISYDPRGYLNLPYTSYITSEEIDILTQVCLQVLIILTDFKPPEIEVVAQYAAKSDFSIMGKIRTDTPLVNEFVQLLCSLTQSEEVLMIYDAIMRILTNFTDSNTSLLPSSLKQVLCYHEAIIFLWKFFEFNTSAIPTILHKSTISSAVGPILFTLNESIGETTNFAMANVCTFMLLKLSHEREFGIGLNKTNKASEYLGIIKGSLADLLLQVYTRAMRYGTQLEFLWPYFLITLSNVSPFIRGINLGTAAELMKLMGQLSNEEWMLSNQTRHYNLFYLFEIFNNLIQYQWEGSKALALQITKNREIFFNIQRLHEKYQPSNQPPPEPTRPQEQPVLLEPQPTVEGTQEQDEDPATVEAVQDQTEEERKASRNVLNSDHLYGESSEEAEREERSSVLNTHISAVTEEAVGPEISETVNMITDTLSDEVWKPDAQWVQTWLPRLPLNPALILIRYLGGILDINKPENELMKRLKDTTIVGILPVPHPIVTRKNDVGSTVHFTWMTSYIWGEILLKSFNSYMFNISKIRLFSLGS